jgi:hypothetical protein
MRSNIAIDMVLARCSMLMFRATTKFGGVIAQNWQRLNSSWSLSLFYSMATWPCVSLRLYRLVAANLNVGQAAETQALVRL